MDLLVLLIVVFIVLALAMWAVYYLPLPPGSPPWMKNFLYVLLLLFAIVVILWQGGVVHR